MSEPAILALLRRFEAALPAAARESRAARERGDEATARLIARTVLAGLDALAQVARYAAALLPYQKLGDTAAEVALRAREAGDPEAAAALNALADALARLDALEVGPVTPGGEAG